MALDLAAHFGRDPQWFSTLPRHEQVRLLAYHRLRFAGLPPRE